jgi:hypothetical protein
VPDTADAASPSLSFEPRHEAVSASGERFAYHGAPLIRASRSLQGVNSARAAGSPLRASSLLVDVTPSFRASIRSSLTATADAIAEAAEATAGGAADRAASLRRVLGESRFATNSKPAAGGSAAATPGGRSLAVSTRPGFLPSASSFEDASGDDSASGSGGPSRFVLETWAASGPHDTLVAALRCLPAAYWNDAAQADRAEGEDHMSCFAHLSNVTRTYPATLVAAHRWLLANPCANPYAGAAAALASPALSSRSAPAFAAAAEATAAVWAADPDGTSCEHPAFSSTSLTHRMVELLVGLVVAAPDPAAAHTDAVLVHMLLRPDAYRYPTVLEAVLRTLFAYDTPSEAVAEAALHVALYVDADGVVADGSPDAGRAASYAAAASLPSSDIQATALLAAAACLAKARAFAEAAPVDIDLGDLGVVSKEVVAAEQRRRERARAAGAARGTFLPAYDAERLDGLLLAHIERLYGLTSADLHDREAAHVAAATEVAALLWPTLPQHAQIRHLAQVERVPDSDMARLIAGAAHARYDDAEREHLELRAVAALRDHLVSETRGDPAALEAIRPRAARAHVLRTPGLGGVRAWNETAAAAVQARRAEEAARAMAYTSDERRDAYASTDTVLRTLGNLAHPAAVPLAARFAAHHDHRLREAAVHALRRAGPTHGLGSDARLRRRLASAVSPRVLGSDSPARVLLEEYCGTPLPSAAPATLTTAPNPSAPEELHHHPSSFARRLLDSWSLFPHAVPGLPPAEDVEGALVAVATSHHDPVAARDAVRALTHMRPLRHETVDALLDMWEARGFDAARDTPACVDACVATRPACAVLPLATCRADCASHCAATASLQLAVADFMVRRVKYEIEDEEHEERKWEEDAAPAGGEAKEALRAGARRLRSALASSPSSSSSHPSTSSSSSSSSSSSYRALSRSGPAPRASPRHLERARRLGIFTLVDFQLGKGIAWFKLFGSSTLGARLSFENRNILRLRVSLFDGMFRVEESNEAAAIAQFWIVRLALLEGKAAVIGGFAYINKLARDIAGGVSRIADKTLGTVQKKAGLALRLIGGLLRDTQGVVDALDAYAESLAAASDAGKAMAPTVRIAAETAGSFSSAMAAALDMPAAARAASALSTASSAWRSDAYQLQDAASASAWTALVAAAQERGRALRTAAVSLGSS